MATVNLKKESILSIKPELPTKSPGIKPYNFSKCVGEAMGTFVIHLTGHYSGGNYFVVPIAVLLLVTLLGPVCDAHFNALCTLFAVVMEKHHNTPRSTYGRVVSYLISQVLGYFLAGVLLVLLKGPDALGHTVPGPTTSTMGALVLETYWTTMLMVWVSYLMHPTSSLEPWRIGALFFLFISIVILSDGNYSGGSINPSIAFASGLLNWFIKGDLDNMILMLQYMVFQLFSIPLASWIAKNFISDCLYPPGQIPSLLNETEANSEKEKGVEIEMTNKEVTEYSRLAE